MLCDARKPRLDSPDDRVPCPARVSGTRMSAKLLLNSARPTASISTASVQSAERRPREKIGLRVRRPALRALRCPMTSVTSRGAAATGSSISHRPKPPRQPNELSMTARTSGPATAKLIRYGMLTMPMTRPRHCAVVVSAMMMDCSTWTPVLPHACRMMPQMSMGNERAVAMTKRPER